MTARWVVDIAEERELELTWKPISLLFKNNPPEDSDYFGPVNQTHNMLRVMESVRAAEGDGPIKDLYFELGTRIHHDKDRDFDIVDALTAVGLDPVHAEALEDESWDAVIREGMDEGLALTGNDVGTPILAFDARSGKRVGYFGPVITRAPKGQEALDLWDGLYAMAGVDGFWELKRTRTESPDFGERPERYAGSVYDEPASRAGRRTPGRNRPTDEPAKRLSRRLGGRRRGGSWRLAWRGLRWRRSMRGVGPR